MASINPIENILNDLEKSLQEYLNKFPDQIEYVRGYEDALAEVGHLLEAQDVSAHTFTVKLDVSEFKDSLKDAVENSTTILYKAIEDFRDLKNKVNEAKTAEAVETVKVLLDSLDLDKLKKEPNSLKGLFQNFEDIMREATNVTTEEAAEANGVGSFEKIFQTLQDRYSEKLSTSHIPKVDPRAQDEIDAYKASVDNGFWEGAPDEDDPLFLEYISNKLLLLVGEIIEAHEEIRNGHHVSTIYYPTNPVGSIYPRDNEGKLHKPEGFLVELADLSIRLDDLVGALHEVFGTPHLYEIKEEKREYNRSRGHKHGKKF